MLINISRYSIFIVLAVIFFGTVANGLPHQDCQQPLGNACMVAKEAAETMKADLPIVLNQTMSIDRVDVDGRAISLRIKLSYDQKMLENIFKTRGYKTPEQMTLAWSLFNETMQKEGLKTACQGSTFKRLIDKGVLVRLNYMFTDQQTLTIVQASTKTCG